MKKLSRLLILAAALSSPAAWADCSYPRAPSKAPDGNTATRDEMVAARKLVVQYDADMTVYLNCLKAEHEAMVAKSDPSQTEEQKQQIAVRYRQKNDAAVDELTEVVARFDEQRRVFLEKNK